MRTGQRNKLFHAIVFFVQNTKGCHKLKLFKLLFFLDFKIYRQTGKSTTGLGYFAWPMGPVPNALYEDLKQPPQDMRDALTIRITADDPDSDGNLKISPRMAFDEDLFTRRELRVMKELAEIYYEATAKMMTEVSHLPGEPWDRTIKEIRRQAAIPYAFALDDLPDSITKEQAEEIAEEARVIAALFG